jgi:hypothetical protein
MKCYYDDDDSNEVDHSTLIKIKKTLWTHSQLNTNNNAAFRTLKKG